MFLLTLRPLLFRCGLCLLLLHHWLSILRCRLLRRILVLHWLGRPPRCLGLLACLLRLHRSFLRPCIFSLILLIQQSWQTHVFLITSDLGHECLHILLRRRLIVPGPIWSWLPTDCTWYELSVAVFCQFGLRSWHVFVPSLLGHTCLARLIQMWLQHSWVILVHVISSVDDHTYQLAFNVSLRSGLSRY